MADYKPRGKRARRQFWTYRHSNDRRVQLAGERQILELISLGAPLPGILNRLGSAIDVQIGNVVTVFSPPDQDENHFCFETQSAMRMGLDVFWFHRILSRDRAFLGTIKIYRCDSRRPTPHEHKLIERMSHLAGIALQRHEDEQDFEKPSGRTEGGIIGAFEGGPPFVIN